MTEKALYWSTLVMSALCLLLFIVSVTLVNGNRDVQIEIARKQEVINVARNLAPLNQQLSQALYDASVEKKNKKIQDLLVAQGFRLPDPQAAATTPKTN